MVSPVATQYVGSRSELVAETLTGGATVTSASYNMKGANSVGYLVNIVDVTTGTTQLEIVASDVTGLTSPIVIKVVDLTGTPLNTIDDQALIECSREEVADVGNREDPARDFGFIGLRVTQNTADIVVANRVGLALDNPRDEATPRITVA